ncbi:MAG TPA: GtrA family protein [Candidatus Saccharimonadales bacterium]|nr:GtrA family protein [Candidatus Saccharimonadales bacterium]
MRFSIIGAGVFGSSLALTFAMVTWLKWPAGVAYAIQAPISIGAKFWLNRRFTWRDRQVALPVAIAKLLLSRPVTIGVSQGVFNALVWSSRFLPEWPYWYVVAHLVATGVVSLIDFKVFDAWVFRAFAHRAPPP